MLITFDEHLLAEEGVHSFACYDVGGDNLIAEVAAIVLDLYVEPEATIESLRKASVGLEPVVSEDELNRILAMAAGAVIPQMNPDAKAPWLQVPRNEVAEVLALAVMELIHSAVVPAARIRHKEVPGMPSRGLDVLAIANTHQIVVCEVKATSSTASPPTVVSASDDSMRAETLKRIGNQTAIIKELTWVHKHAKPEHRNLAAQAMILYSRLDCPTPIIAPVLVRPEALFQESDYGSFRSNPAEFDPSPISFVVLRLPYDLETFADLVYTEAAAMVAYRD